MEVRGTIYFHPKFKFKNGYTNEKLILLLNTPSKNEPYVFVKTTSQQKNKPLRPGCLKAQRLYFIPAGTSFFQTNTWVQLYEIYEMKASDLDNNPDVRIKGNLNSNVVDKIIDCLFVAAGDDIPPIQKRLLRAPIQDGILKLKEKFR